MSLIPVAVSSLCTLSLSLTTQTLSQPPTSKRELSIVIHDSSSAFSLEMDLNIYWHKAIICAIQVRANPVDCKSSLSFYFIAFRLNLYPVKDIYFYLLEGIFFFTNFCIKFLCLHLFHVNLQISRKLLTQYSIVMIGSAVIIAANLCINPTFSRATLNSLSTKYPQPLRKILNSPKPGLLIIF